jgi:ketosteroid isomerase-like protein
MAAEDDVRQASDRFYTALNRMLNGDAGPLSEVWSHESDVTTMHPIGGRQVGWEQVRPVWEQVAHICSGGRVWLEDQLLRTGGDLAYEVGTERGQATMAGQSLTLDHRVTNVYRREAGGWKIVHHHADISPEMQELLRRLQSQQRQTTR